MYWLAPLAMVYLYANGSQTQKNECEGIDRAEKMRGLYENKIRFFCGPEKIFEIFASKRNDQGKLVMTYSDFYKAVTPYNYAPAQNVEEYFKRFKPITMNIIDADSSGCLTFTEFFFFILIMQIPVNTMRKQFAKYPDKLMDADQFSKTLRKLRRNTTTGGKQVNTVKFDGRTISATEEEFLETNKQLVEKIFLEKAGKSGHGHANKICFDDFLALRKEFKMDLIQYDFFTYDTDENDTISIEDFLKSTIIVVQ